MDIIEQVKERLAIFKNLYDVIRIVDPIQKKATPVIGDKIQELNGACYELWAKNVFCENCITMRAYINNDTFIKVENDKEKIILITATPIDIDGNVFVLEILKDITQNHSGLHKLTESIGLDSLIDYNIEIPDLVLKIHENLYKEKSSRRNKTITGQGNVNDGEIANINKKNIKLLKLNKQITEVREMLNEACCTFHAGEINSERLVISQCLDELIVEYMKEINNS